MSKTKIITHDAQGWPRAISAEYHGGAYIELRFGHLPTPTEVINVYDYATGDVEDPALRHKDSKVRIGAVRKQVLAWIETQDEEWPEWYEGYLENGRF